MCELIFMKIGGPNKVILRVKNQDANIKRIEIKLSNLCFLTGYQTLIGERKFYALGVIFGNLPRLRDSLRHYLRSPKNEGRQIRI